jgi:hypothetical protein
MKTSAAAISTVLVLLLLASLRLSPKLLQCGPTRGVASADPGS